MSFSNIPANSNSNESQNTVPTGPMSNFPSMNQPISSNDSPQSTGNKPAFQAKRKAPLKVILGGIVFVLLLIGGAAGLYLTQMQQDVRQQASTGAYCGGLNQSPCRNYDPVTDAAVGQPFCNAGLVLNASRESCISATDSSEQNITCYLKNALSGTCVVSNNRTECINSGYETEALCKAAGYNSTNDSTTCGGLNESPCVEGGERICDSGLVTNSTGLTCINDRVACFSTNNNCIDGLQVNRSNCTTAENRYTDKSACQAALSGTGGTTTCGGLNQIPCQNYDPVTDGAVGQPFCNQGFVTNAAKTSCVRPTDTNLNCAADGQSIDLYGDCCDGFSVALDGTTCRPTGSIGNVQDNCWVPSNGCTSSNIQYCEDRNAFSSRSACLASITCGSFNQPPCVELDGDRTCKNGLVTNSTGTYCKMPTTNVVTGDDDQGQTGGSTPNGQCVAIHYCDSLYSYTEGSWSFNDVCVNQNPQINSDTTISQAKAQELANQSCKCVQLDLLSGGNESCDNGHINGDMTTLLSAYTACPTVSCQPTTPTPDDSTRILTPPDEETTPEPPTPPVTYQCNSTCTTDLQCQGVDSSFTCATTDNGNRCRLGTNVPSTTCQPAVGPMCMSITLNNVSNPSAGSAGVKVGDAVTLTCGEVSGAASYIFRILQADGTITDLSSTGRTSESFNITSSGQHTAQCQICTGTTADTCLPYEPYSAQ